MGQTRQLNSVDVPIASKNMNGHHCNILFSQESGWTINEHGKAKVSTKGTFVYVKNYKQLMLNEPSSLVPISKNQEFRIGLRSSDYIISFDMKYKNLHEDDLNIS